MPLIRLSLLLGCAVLAAIAAFLLCDAKREGHGSETFGSASPTSRSAAPALVSREKLDATEGEAKSRNLCGRVQFIGGKDPGGPIHGRLISASGVVAEFSVDGDRDFRVKELPNETLTIELRCPNAVATLRRSIGHKTSITLRLPLRFPLKFSIETKGLTELPSQVEAQIRETDPRHASQSQSLLNRGGLFLWPNANLSPGRSYQLVVHAPGFRPSTLDFATHPTQEAELLVVQLEPEAQTSGQVLWADTRQAVAGARVRLVDQSKSLRGEVATDEEGRFTLASIPQDSAHLILQAEHPQALAAVSIPLAAAPEGAILLKAAGSIELLPIPEGPSHFVGQATIILRSQGFPPLTINPQGSAALPISHLPPGPLTVEIQCAPSQWSWTIETEVQRHGHRKIHVPAGPGSCTINGTLRFHADEAAHINVLLYDSSGELIEKVPVPAGEREFHLSRLVRGDYQIATEVLHRNKPVASPRRPITLEPGVTPVTLTVRFQ